MTLLKQVKELRNSEIKNVVEGRLKEFENLGELGNDDWFCELCFCLLTANSRAQTAINIQKQLGKKGFLKLSQEEISKVIRENKHRFHNNKSKYIVGAREFQKIKDLLCDLNEVDKRDFLVRNVKGLGYKESSHFLRNVGYKNVAILDRHILNLMVSEGYLDVKPNSLSPKNYLEIEAKFIGIAKELGMNLAELDLYMWYLKTGTILK